MSATPAYRAAIIGTGRIASLLERDPLRPRPSTHAGWYKAESRTRLVAGCDVDADRLSAFGRDWGIATPHLYTAYTELLQREQPDVVSVCAYAPSRVAMCKAALASGARALWIEKAVACAIDEAEDLARAVSAAGAVAVVDHPRRLDARHRAVARWLRDGALGTLETVHVTFSGHIVHTGTHAWDLLLAWLGPWVRVEASLDPVVDVTDAGETPDGRTDVDTARNPSVFADASATGVRDRGGRARIVFANGVEAFVTGGAKRYFIFQCDIIGSGGRVRIGNDVFEKLVPADSPRYSGFRELAAVDPAAAMRPEDTAGRSVLATLLDSLETGATPLLSVAAATEALALGIAIVQAGLTGTAVTPKSLDRTLRVASV